MSWFWLVCVGLEKNQIFSKPEILLQLCIENFKDERRKKINMFVQIFENFLFTISTILILYIEKFDLNFDLNFMMED